MIKLTSMHSSRMRTARLLTISRSIRKEEGRLPWGCIQACNGADTPPPVNRITDRCKNITLPQTSFADGNKATPLWMTRLVTAEGYTVTPMCRGCSRVRLPQLSFGETVGKTFEP